MPCVSVSVRVVVQFLKNSNIYRRQCVFGYERDLGITDSKGVSVVEGVCCGGLWVMGEKVRGMRIIDTNRDDTNYTLGLSLRLV